MRVSGAMLLSGTPWTVRSLKAEPSELNDDALPLALATAIARTALAVTRPLRTLTFAVSAVPVCTASAGDAVTVLREELRTTSARSTEPLEGRLAFSSSLSDRLEPTPDCLPEEDASVWSIPRSGSLTRAPYAPPRALARSGRSTAKLTGSTAVRSLSSDVIEVEDRVFM